MQYKIELGRDAVSYGNIVGATTFRAIGVLDRDHPVIHDLIDTATNNDDPEKSQKAADILTQLPEGALQWLRAADVPFRIEGEWLWKDAPQSAMTNLIGGKCVTYGYCLTVYMDSLSQSLLFKLTYGGC